MQPGKAALSNKIDPNNIHSLVLIGRLQKTSIPVIGGSMEFRTSSGVAKDIAKLEVPQVFWWQTLVGEEEKNIERGMFVLFTPMFTLNI